MLRGFDASNWQGTINWPQVKADNYDFALVKATEGLSIIDADFYANWSGAKAVGLVRGAYAFTRPEVGNPEGQAAHFVQTVGVWEPGDLAAGDFETPEVGGDESIFALAFLGAVKQAIGFGPLVYCNQDWAQHRLTDTRMAAYNLWLSCLDPQALPAAIGVWKTVAMQQYSFTLTIPGIGGEVDGDRIARTLAGLRALGKPAPGPVGSHVTKQGVLKTKPFHGSDPVRNGKGDPYILPVGTDVKVMGKPKADPVNQDLWVEVTVVAPLAVGWFLKNSIAEGP